MYHLQPGVFIYRSSAKAFRDAYSHNLRVSQDGGEGEGDVGNGEIANVQSCRPSADEPRAHHVRRNVSHVCRSSASRSGNGTISSSRPPAPTAKPALPATHMYRSSPPSSPSSSPPTSSRPQAPPVQRHRSIENRLKRAFSSKSEESVRKRDAKNKEKSHTSSSKYECPLCFEGDRGLCSVPCGHVFCTGCIHEALRVDKRCPLCRRSAVHGDLRRIFLGT